MEAKFEYTQNLKKIFDTRTEKLQSYYSREDITEARNEYIQAPADAKQFRWKDLERMCKARKIDQNQVIEDETLLEKIPTREEMKKELLQIFVEMYSEFPKTSCLGVYQYIQIPYTSHTITLRRFRAYQDTGSQS